MLDWMVTIPQSPTKSPYGAMGRKVGFENTQTAARIWFEGLYHHKTNMRIGACLWFNRRSAPAQIFLCLGVLYHPVGRHTWTVVGVERKFAIPCPHLDNLT
jgi:hypothetical protein